MRNTRLHRYLLVVAGSVCVALGAVGALLPILPTTPFLLLAAACFMRSSDRLYGWLLRNRWFGSYIRNYREHRAISRRAKVVTLALLWLAIGYSVVAGVRNLVLRILLFVVASCVTLHLLRLRTISPEMIAGTGGGMKEDPDPDGPTQPKGSPCSGNRASHLRPVEEPEA